MQPLPGSAGPPAGEPFDISGEQHDQYQDVLTQGGSAAISSDPSSMMREQDMSVVQVSSNAASAFTVAPPRISTSISSTSTVTSTTATQY